MNDMTCLYRQIHPSLFQNGRVQSSAFRPKPSDDRHLSVYNGNYFSAKQSHEHYSELKRNSIGVLHVTVFDCYEYELSINEDNNPFVGHASIVFSEELSNSKIEKIARKLTMKAWENGWDYYVGEDAEFQS